MTDETQTAEPHEATAPETFADADSGADSRADGGAAPEDFGEALVAKLTAAEAEVATLKDQMLRAMADAENLRRRTQKEMADARAYAVSKFAESLLSVADNLGRALATAPDALKADPAFDGFLKGVEMTERELINAFEKHGLTRVGAPGDPFDPAVHQAVAQVPSADVAAGAVAQVFQPGYVLSGRTLRAAMVAVSAGPAA